MLQTIGVHNVLYKAFCGQEGARRKPRLRPGPWRIGSVRLLLWGLLPCRMHLTGDARCGSQRTCPSVFYFPVMEVTVVLGASRTILRYPIDHLGRQGTSRSII